MKTFSGTSLKNKATIGILTTSEEVVPRGNYILIKDIPKTFDLGYAGYLCTSSKLPLFSRSGIMFPNLGTIKEAEGDIALVMPDGKVCCVWEKASHQNALFLTDSCNARCLMCPQPPQKHDPKHIKNAHKILDYLYGSSQYNICITGGEPTLVKSDFVELLKRCVCEHPEAHIEILTNGQTLSNFEFVKTIASVCTNKVRFCISLHADSDELHDKIVQRKDAFKKTHQGIFNLRRFGISTEIRFVVNKINYKRLSAIPNYIFRTYPFIDHLVIIGLEMTGYALDNEASVWIDPFEYQEEILAFVKEASRRRLPFSIYNHPLCVLPQEAQKFARKSISDWKQSFAADCLSCSKKDYCCGIFTTSESRVSKHINAFE